MKTLLLMFSECDSHKCPHRRCREDRPMGVVGTCEVGQRLERAATAKEARVCKEQGRPVPWSLPRELGPADTSVSDLWPPELGEEKFLLF